MCNATCILKRFLRKISVKIISAKNKKEPTNNLADLKLFDSLYFIITSCKTKLNFIVFEFLKCRIVYFTDQCLDRYASYLSESIENQNLI